jgi:hypothetical protein
MNFEQLVKQIEVVHNELQLYKFRAFYISYSQILSTVSIKLKQLKEAVK